MFDPYYCNGAIRKHYEKLGFHSLRHEVNNHKCFCFASTGNKSCCEPRLDLESCWGFALQNLQGMVVLSA